ncbi:MAG TPA: tetratricopeptide repeat protein, partial [Gemmataceae bacterium]
MRKVNKKLFFFLLLSVAVLTGGVFLAHYFQSGRVKAALLRQVERAEEQKQPDKVVQYLSRYLDFAPDDLEERVHLAKTLARESPTPIPKARERAIYNLETVLARDPDRVELRLLLTRVAIETKRWELAREQLALLDKVNLQDGETERLRAMYEEGQEHFDQAEKFYAQHIERASRQGSHQIESYTRRAYLLRGRLKQPALADQAMQDMIQANPDDSQAYLNRWRYRVEFGLLKKDELEAGDKDVARALELAPNDAETLLAAAERAWKAEHLDAALPYLNRGREAYPTDFRFYLSQATIETDARQYAAAEECLRQGVEAVRPGSRFVLLWNLANLLIDAADESPVDETEFDRVIKKIAKSNPPLGSVDYLKARLAMTRGKWPEAITLLETARPSLQFPADLANQVNLHLAHCYEQQDNIVDQRAAYERVILRDPQTGEILKAAGLAKAGLARLALQQHLKTGQGNDLDVQRALAEAGLAKSPSAELKLLSVEYLVALQKFDDARRLLQEARKEDPKKVEFAVALAVLAARQGQIGQARDLLDQADKEFGDKAELRLARMQFLASFDGTGAAAKLAELGNNLDKFSSPNQAKLLRGLAETHQALGNSKEAKQFWTRLADHPRHQQDARVRLLLLDQAMQANDDAAVRDVLAQIHKIEGEQGTLWQYASAVHRIWLKKRGQPSNLDEARALLDRVLKTRPDWPAALLTLAELEDLRANHELAAQLYRRAFEGSRRNPLVLTQLLGSEGLKPEQVEQNLLRAVELASAVPETWIAYVEFLAGRDPKKAEAALTKAKEALKGL